MCPRPRRCPHTGRHAALAQQEARALCGPLLCLVTALLVICLVTAHPASAGGLRGSRHGSGAWLPAFLPPRGRAGVSGTSRPAAGCVPQAPRVPSLTAPADSATVQPWGSAAGAFRVRGRHGRGRARGRCVLVVTVGAQHGPREGVVPPPSQRRREEVRQVLRPADEETRTPVSPEATGGWRSISPEKQGAEG